MPTSLILASGSRYKAQLLERLRVPFQVHSADADETPQEAESASNLAARLARVKAQTIASRSPEALVIGADQVAVCDDRILGKPGTAQRCADQLRGASGKNVSFLTAVCVVRGSDRRFEAHLDTTTVRFRTLSDTEISRYVELERPFDCAGGFKAEGLGISLFERIDSQDPTALIGLPLIWLAGALRRAGLI